VGSRIARTAIVHNNDNGISLQQGEITGDVHINVGDDSAHSLLYTCSSDKGEANEQQRTSGSVVCWARNGAELVGS